MIEFMINSELSSENAGRSPAERLWEEWGKEELGDEKEDEEKDAPPGPWMIFLGKEWRSKWTR